MTRFFHVIGERGSGKSGLIVALARQFEQRGLRCAGQDPAVYLSRAEACVNAPASADICFVEHLNEAGLDALLGETVIKISFAGRPSVESPT